MPEKVRNAASQNIEPLAIKYIEEYVKMDCSGDILEMLRNKDLPEKVRIAAIKNVEPLEIKFIDELIKKRDYVELTERLDDKLLPEKVRKYLNKELTKIAKELV